MQIDTYTTGSAFVFRQGTKEVGRAVTELAIADRKSLDMDITAYHNYGGGLHLQQLLDSSSSDFGHDVRGISRYIDRTTGKMTQHFAPRFSA